MEEWRGVIGYEGLYEVSSLGRVKALAKIDSSGKSRKEKILNPSMSHGYLVLVLVNNSVRKNRSVHSLVAESFLGHIPNGHTLVVHHKNNIPLDNRVCNLEIVTKRGNSHTHHVGASKCKGISWDSSRNKWKASIYHNGKIVYLGRFKNEKDACSAYREYKLNNNIK